MSADPERRSQRLRRKREGIDARPIRVDDFQGGTRTDLRLPIYQDALSNKLEVPFVVLRGRHPGPVLGVSAAVHGDELNGIQIIHHLLERLDPAELHGTILCAPVVNVPAYQNNQRRFPEDERDLNHVFPGKLDGTPSEQYARAFLTTFLTPLDFLIDIHTASEGRVNSFYVRADLHSNDARQLALLMNPEIVLHGRSGDGTLRNAARVRGVPAITVEAGNPSVFQGRMVLEGELGIVKILTSLRMLIGVPEHLSAELPARTPVICKSSRWLRTRAGGLLLTECGLREQVKKRQRLALVRDPFGHLVAEYDAPNDGIVIGKSALPVAVPGTRYCHLGLVGEPPLRSTKRERAIAAEHSSEGESLK